jgi:hypothetical protein
MNALTEARAARFARSTLAHIGREYPNKLDHVLHGPADAASPSALHPIFFGSYDWHSCVHGWWQLMALARLFPAMDEAAAIHARADRMLTPEKAAGELAYLARPGAGSFERPYGWAWLLALHGELVRRPEARWAKALAPLAEAFAEAFKSYLPKLTYPGRAGTHANTSFALVLAQAWAGGRDAELVALIAARAQAWFAADRACQAWELGGEDFLSPALTEALLMSRVLPPAVFAGWFEGFLPDLEAGRPAAVLGPVAVSDRGDGRIVHLDGLNLSRAWCWRGIARALPRAHPAAAVAERSAEAHLAAGLPHVEGDYMGEHWLASFALLALADPL